MQKEQKAWEASKPLKQLQEQTREEEAWLRKAERLGLRPKLRFVRFHELAYQSVRERWQEQGIWDWAWATTTGRNNAWKHERPLEPEPESDTDVETLANTVLYLFLVVHRSRS